MDIWEIIGTVLGVIGVTLMIRQNIWAWPVGLVQVAVYGWVFFNAKLYSDALLQGAFFAILAYGWFYWLRGGRRESAVELPVTRLSTSAQLGLLALGAMLTAAWGWLMHAKTDADLPWWDAFILVFSLIAQWLQARKKLENWLGWIAVNSVAIGVYWVKGLHLTAGLYVIFWGLAVAGWITWRKSLVLAESA